MCRGCHTSWMKAHIALFLISFDSRRRAENQRASSTVACEHAQARCLHSLALQVDHTALETVLCEDDGRGGQEKSSYLWGVDIALLHIARHPGKCPVLFRKTIDADVALNPPNCNQSIFSAGDCTCPYLSAWMSWALYSQRPRREVKIQAGRLQCPGTSSIFIR